MEYWVNTFGNKIYNESKNIVNDLVKQIEKIRINKLEQKIAKLKERKKAKRKNKPKINYS
jgi:uncharacterized membrane protein YgcG